MRTTIIMFFLLTALTSLTKAQSHYSISDSKSSAWQWDTIVTWNSSNVFDERHIQTFDNNGKLLIQIFQRWHWLPNYWKNYHRFTYTYDGSGNVLSKLEQNCIDSTWINYQRDTYAYDGNGNIWAQLHEYWQNNSWYNSSRYTFTYDNSGNMLTKFIEEWHLNSWENDYRFHFNYDSTGNLLSRYDESWQNNTWNYNNRLTYYYDSLGIMQYWTKEHGQNNIWVNQWKWSYTYNSVGDTLMRLYHAWVDTIWVACWKYTYTYDFNHLLLTNTEVFFSGGQWVNDIKYTCTYDPDGNLIEYLTQQYDTSWVNFRRSIYTHDIDGNILTELVQDFQDWQDMWNDDYRYTFTYDANGNSITGKYEYPNGQPDEYYLPVYSDNVVIYWFYFYRYEAHFTSFGTTIVNCNMDIGSNIIYPNPAIDNITISCPSMNNEGIITIYNVQGQMLLQKKANQDKTVINISSLAKGVYIVTVVGSDINISKKIIKE